MANRNLLVITTGGTIAGNVASTDSNGPGRASSEAAGNMREILSPVLKYISDNYGIDVDVTLFEAINVDSSDIRPHDWQLVIDKIWKEYDRYDGFVVTHGTNTMGYTSAAFSFALANLAKPVVVTGSQVPFGWLGSDALTNLENAIRVAVWPYEGGIRGVIVVFGSQIITGTRAKKNTEFDYDAFQSFSSASLGRIGRIIDLNKDSLDRHHAYLGRPRAPALRRGQLDVKNKFDGRLLSFTEFPGMDAKVFTHLLTDLINDAQLNGVVFRAFGAGDVSNHLHPALEYLKERMIPIVVTMQAPNGNANFAVNEPGQKLDREQLAIPAYDMSIESITAKLMWLLGQEVPYEMMRIRMHEDLHGEVSPRIEHPF